MMDLHCGLANEMYKYSYGNYNPWQVPFGEQEDIQLVCGKNDRVATQLLLYSKEEMMVSLEASPAFYKVYPVPTVRVEVESCIKGLQVTTQLVELVRDDDGNYKSEVLLSKGKKFQERLKVQPTWIELATDDEVEAGEYSVTVKVYVSHLLQDETLYRTLRIKLRVMDVRVPSLHEGKFYLDLWQHHTSLARTYEVGLWSEDHFALLKDHLKVLQELGQKAITIIASDIPWSGQWSTYYRTNASDTFEYNMISVKKKADGTFGYDFSAMNRYVQMCLEMGIDGEIEIFGLLGIWTMEDAGYTKVIEDSQDAIRIRYLDEVTGTYCYIRKRKELEAYIRAIDENIVASGWSHLAKVVCDEPNDPAHFKHVLSDLLELMPHVQFKVTICSMQTVLEDLPGVNDYVLNLPLILDRPDRIQVIRQEKNVNMSYYVAIDPKCPNTFLRCYLAEARFLPWLSMLMDMDGFLRWAIWLWPNEPFDFESYHYQKFKAGGTHFVYPSKRGKPLYSLRYKNLQKGIRDYLIFQMYAEAFEGKEEVHQAIKSIMKVKQIEEMAGRYRKNADEVLSLNYWEYEKVVNQFMSRLETLVK
ncbi:MAG: DUF4091 domain-containing protein [Niameybacter sp.]|uniref:DUF4091 domain-containing protein n=1 Tax=Niameybacter sp. TaxID=2033640 RepID=UPI002FC97F43